MAVRYRIEKVIEKIENDPSGKIVLEKSQILYDEIEKCFKLQNKFINKSGGYIDGVICTIICYRENGEILCRIGGSIRETVGDGEYFATQTLKNIASADVSEITVEILEVLECANPPISTIKKQGVPKAGNAPQNNTATEEARLKARAEAKAKADAKAEAEAKAKAEAKAIATAKAKAEAEAKAIATAKAKAEAEEKAAKKAQAEAEASNKAQAQKEAAAQAKAQKEAEAKAAAEAKEQEKAQAKAQAAANAEAEKQQKAEEKAQKAEEKLARKASKSPKNAKKIVIILMAILLICAIPAVIFLSIDQDAQNGFIIEDGVLVEYTGEGGDVIIPDSVTAIGDRAFLTNGTITSVTIPDSCTKIYNYAFSNCRSLTQVDLGGVQSVADYAFTNCSSLENIDLKNVSVIGEGAFSSCSSLKSVEFCDELYLINTKTFSECSSLENVDFNNVTQINDNAFIRCLSLTDLNLENVQKIDSYAFYYCSELESISFGADLSQICLFAFYNCSAIESINFDESLDVSTVIFEANAFRLDDFPTCNVVLDYDVISNFIDIRENVYEVLADIISQHESFYYSDHTVRHNDVDILCTSVLYSDRYVSICLYEDGTVYIFTEGDDNFTIELRFAWSEDSVYYKRSSTKYNAEFDYYSNDFYYNNTLYWDQTISDSMNEYFIEQINFAMSLLGDYVEENGYSKEDIFLYD
ncbi:MAG: leucine-rich repeat domain-containing protein [Bacillota bacterium]